MPARFMSLAPAMPFSPIPELLDEIRAGRMVVIVDDEDRENEGDLIMAAELVRPQDINFMVTHARGLVCLSLTRERCRQLGLPPMVRDNTSPHHTNFTVSIEAAEGVTTGISAYDRAHTVRTAVRPDAQPRDLSQPGHIFPLMAQPGGVLNRAGHTEAAADLALLAGMEPCGRAGRDPQCRRQHGAAAGAGGVRRRARPEDRLDRGTDPLPPRDRAHGRARRRARDRDRARRISSWSATATASATRCISRCCAASPTRRRRRWCACTCRTRSPMRCTGGGPDFGPAVGDVLATIAREGRGALVLLGDNADAEALLARVRAASRTPTRTLRRRATRWPNGGAMAPAARSWPTSGLGKLRVLGTPRKQIGLAGFGLEVVEYVELPR